MTLLRAHIYPGFQPGREVHCDLAGGTTYAVPEHGVWVCEFCGCSDHQDV